MLFERLQTGLVMIPLSKAKELTTVEVVISDDDLKRLDEVGIKYKIKY